VAAGASLVAASAVESSFVEATATAGDSFVVDSTAGDWFVEFSATEVTMAGVTLVETSSVAISATRAVVSLVEIVPVEPVADSPGCTAAAPELLPDVSPEDAEAAGQTGLSCAQPETKPAAMAAHKPE
jgi:hypothetical protein